MHHVQNRSPRTHLWAALAVVAAAAVVGTITTVLVLTGDSGENSSAGTNPFQLGGVAGAPLENAATECAAGTLTDEDETLVIDMAGEEYGSGTATFADIECVLDELGAPHSIVAKMGATRALDGMRTASWPDYEATWTYHPDDGLDVILTRAG